MRSRRIADVSPDIIRLTGSGRVEKQPLVLRQAAVLTRSGDGWQLAPTSIGFGGGSAVVSGRTGSRPEVHAQVAAMPLQVLDLIWPGMGLSGSASGHVDYAWRGNRSGSVNLTVHGLSRAGLVLASKPIDVGIAAVVTGDKAAIRAVAASNGAIIGRAQARFTPIGNGSLATELLNAPLFAQLRYVGPADTLWRLSGTEIVDLSGPISVAADIGGRWSNPVIHGSLKTGDARLESAVTGMVIDHLAAQAHFSGPQLVFTQLTGQTSGGGTLSGGGLRHLRERQDRAQPRVQRQSGAAPQPRRRRCPGHGPAGDPVEWAGRHHLGQPPSRQGPVPARPRQQRRIGAPAQRARHRPGRGRRH